MLIIDKIKCLFDFFVGSKFFFQLVRKAYFSKIFPFVHSVTYHDTAKEFTVPFRLQLQWYKDHYANCDFNTLRDFLAKGRWEDTKPGLIITFDDGLKTNYDVALPLLEEFGFTAWFMVPPGFVNIIPENQCKFASKQLIEFSSVDKSGRIAMSWEELRDVERRGHIITCHSMFHKRLSSQLTNSELIEEIKDSKVLLENQLEHPINLFTWVGGEEWAYSNAAFKMLVAEKYDMIFCTNCAPIKAKQMPYFLERYHVEPSYSINRLRVILGGFYDLLYWRKRQRVFKKLVK